MALGPGSFNAEVTLRFDCVAAGSLASAAKHAATGWFYTGPTAATKKIYYVGDDLTPFGGGKYILVGTDTDGLTLKLTIFDGTTTTSWTGATMLANTWYYWGYFRGATANLHSVYYGGIGSTPATTLTITQTVADGVTPNGVFFFIPPSCRIAAAKVASGFGTAAQSSSDTGLAAAVWSDTITSDTSFVNGVRLEAPFRVPEDLRNLHLFDRTGGLYDTTADRGIHPENVGGVPIAFVNDPSPLIAQPCPTLIKAVAFTEVVENPGLLTNQTVTSDYTDYQMDPESAAALPVGATIYEVIPAIVGGAFLPGTIGGDRRAAAGSVAGTATSKSSAVTSTLFGNDHYVFYQSHGWANPPSVTASTLQDPVTAENWDDLAPDVARARLFAYYWGWESTWTTVGTNVSTRTHKNKEIYLRVSYVWDGNYPDAPDPGFRHRVIEYTGDAFAGRTIITGFPLDTGVVAVSIHPVLPAGSGTATPPVVRTSADGDSWLDGSVGTVVDFITSFTAVGFILGAGDAFGKVNAAGVKYIAVVLCDSTIGNDYLRVGVYTGNATDNRQIAVQTNWQPTHVWVHGNSFVYRSTDFTGDSSVTLRNQVAGANMVQGFYVDGFEIGTSVNVNTNSNLYGYIAIRAVDTFLASGFASFKTTGTAAASDAVTGFGFEPAFAVAKRYDASIVAYYKGTTFPNNPTDGGDDSQGWASTNNATDGLLSLDADGITVGEAIAPNTVDVYGYAWRDLTNFAAFSLQKVTQLVLLVAEDEDADADPPPEPIGGASCTGGGTVASGVDPGAETSLATVTTPLVWVKLTKGAAIHEWSKVGIPYGTMKYARVASFGRAKRALSNGDSAPEASRVTLRLFDTDGAIRALAAAGTIEGALIEYFAADLATLQASGTPSRRFRGRVTRHQAVENLEYEIEIQDELSARLTSIDQDDLQTPQTLIDNAISDQNPTERMFDKPIPEAYGSISDGDADDPVWECKHVGNISVPGFESLGNMPAFLVCLGVVSQIKRIDGADLSSGDPPTSRAPLPASAMTGPDPYIYVPTMAGYFDANPWYLQSGRRYTLIFGKDGHPVIMLAVQGRIPLAVNFCGYETVGDSSSATIDKPARALLHWLNNRVAQNSLTNWLSQASFGDYSLLDTDSFETVADYQDTLGAGSPTGLVIGGLIGADYQQRSWRDRIEEWCRNFGFSYGINRHGQGMLHMLDRTDAAASAPAFTESNILEGSVSTDLKKEAVEDAVRYVYAPEHLTALPALTPVEGAPLYREPYDGKWRSGLQSYGAGVRPSRVQEYNLVRDEFTAVTVAAERYDLRSLAGGRAEPAFDVWFKDGCLLELGQVVTVTHHDLPWTGAKRCQILALEEDFDEFVITPHVQNVHDLLP